MIIAVRIYVSCIYVILNLVKCFNALTAWFCVGLVIMSVHRKMHTNQLHIDK